MNKTCYNCGAPISKETCEDFPEVCDAWKPKPPQTNYDRIISKTPAGLAYFMMRTTDCPCIARETGCCRSDISCQKAWLDWLKQEASHEP